MEALRSTWTSRWEEALALWSRFTRLSPPRFCATPEAAREEGLSGSFAMIRILDHAVVIDLHGVVQHGLEQFPLEIMAHEIGHHVLCPSNLADQARMLARMRRGLPGFEARAALIGNLYGDLLINDRLQRSGQVRIDRVYGALGAGSKDRLWTFYMRIYEVLWSLPRGTLVGGETDPVLECDAQLGARLVRSYAADWMRGCGRFAALCLPYLEQDGGQALEQILRGWLDAQEGGDAVPAGLTELEPDEIEGAIHPRDDPELSGVEADANTPPHSSGASGGGQSRTPFEYGQILKALGVRLDDHELAMRYYRERAQPYLVSFPTRTVPESEEPLPEGLEAWDIGSPLEEVDWLESVMVSPRLIPGLTTVRRTYGTIEGSGVGRQPVDLDLYIDCSGSMPNPQRDISYLILAGVIVARSALRVGSAVQVTLWSGPGQFQKTRGFERDESEVLRILTGYLNGSTAFPLHVLRETYAVPLKRRVHVMVISDDGVDTMLNKDEKGTPGEVVVRQAMASAGGGGSLVLRLSREVEACPSLQPLKAMGLFDIYRVVQWEELIAFARNFSRNAYGRGART